MKLDIIFVTYNSKKWLDPNIKSILESDYDLKNNISLLYYDNASTDDTYNVLEELKNKYGKKFRNFKIKRGNKNKGFGYGNNRAVELGNSEYLLILNTDTEIKKDTLKKIEKELSTAKKEEVIFELKQEPYEHPKYYDPITRYVSWTSGACFIIKREMFEKIGGFDQNIFMYCEDVDLSWNIRKRGYKIKYLYNVGITHYSYTKPNEFKENQFIYSYVNNLYIRCKYGSFKNSLKGLLITLRAIKNNYLQDVVPKEESIRIRKKLAKETCKMFFKYIYARLYKHTHKTIGDFRPKFYQGIDYECQKINPFKDRTFNKSNCKKKVSIIVRTCGRPNVLRENLISLRNQTYKNFEVVIVEDGKNISEKMIKEEFSDLDIKYEATIEKKGRCYVGNRALELSTGDFLNFLDDDDVFYPEHIQNLVEYADKNHYDIVYDTAFETKIEILNKNPYIYSIKDVNVVHKEKYTRKILLEKNIFPIQVVMFNRKVYEKLGGLDESVDALEDWDLWLKYSQKYEFHFLEDTTSIYRVPNKIEQSRERQEFIDSYTNKIRSKYNE